MAYTKCSRCGDTFHLRLTSEQALNELHEKEKEHEVLCFGCFRTIKEFDVVQVIVINPQVPEAKAGDKGAVVMVHGGGDGKSGYEVECVLPNGTSKWQGGFKREQLKWLQSPNEKNT